MSGINLTINPFGDELKTNYNIIVYSREKLIISNDHKPIIEWIETSVEQGGLGKIVKNIIHLITNNVHMYITTDGNCYLITLPQEN